MALREDGEKLWIFRHAARVISRRRASTAPNPPRRRIRTSGIFMPPRPRWKARRLLRQRRRAAYHSVRRPEELRSFARERGPIPPGGGGWLTRISAASISCLYAVSARTVPALEVSGRHDPQTHNREGVQSSPIVATDRVLRSRDFNFYAWTPRQRKKWAHNITCRTPRGGCGRKVYYGTSIPPIFLVRTAADAQRREDPMPLMVFSSPHSPVGRLCGQLRRLPL
jgi:hypothetical protein